MLYKFLSALFMLVRQFYLPNPFNVLEEGITVMINGFPILLTPIILNWIAGFVLPVFTYVVVGLYYNRGSYPELGSFLYMVFFLVHTGMIYIVLLVYTKVWLVMLISVAYIGIHFALLTLKKHIFF